MKRILAGNVPEAGKLLILCCKSSSISISRPTSDSLMTSMISALVVGNSTTSSDGFRALVKAMILSPQVSLRGE